MELDPGEVMVFALAETNEPVNSIVGTENVYKVMDVNGETMLAVSESGNVVATYSDGTTITEEVTAPADVPLDKWNLVVDSYEPGDKKTRTATTEETGITTTEVTYETNHVMIDVGTLEELASWKDIPAIGEEISGVGTYTSTFVLPEDWDVDINGLEFKAESYSGGTVAITVNGEKLSVNMDSSTIDISDYVHPGKNIIEVRVTTTLRNRMIVQGYSGWNMSPAIQVNQVIPDDYGMVGETELITYTKVPATVSHTNNSILNAVITYAETAKESGEYDNAIESVQKSFDAALENAKTVANNAGATQEEVDTAWKTLLNEIHKLGFVAGDKTELASLIEAANEINAELNRYVEAGKAEFTAALEAAQGCIQ